MRKSSHAAAKVFLPPTQMDWTDEKLAALSKEQLVNLFANLKIQRDTGRVSEQVAEDISRRIAERLPATVFTVRRKRPRSQVMLETRAAEELSGLATELGQRYDLSAETAQQRSAGVKGFRPHTMTGRSGEAKTGGTVKSGRTSIDRYISYRVGNTLASLAFLLIADQPNETGRYVVLATDDLLEDEAPENEFTPLAREYGWSDGSRARMRARPAANFAEAQQMYEALIARVATRFD
jgi:hypothetical protein